MEPREFNEQLGELIEEARESGLHVNHIQNSLRSHYNDIDDLKEAWEEVE